MSLCSKAFKCILSEFAIRTGVTALSEAEATEAEATEAKAGSYRTSEGRSHQSRNLQATSVARWLLASPALRLRSDLCAWTCLSSALRTWSASCS